MNLVLHYQKQKMNCRKENEYLKSSPTTKYGGDGGLFGKYKSLVSRQRDKYTYACQMCFNRQRCANSIHSGHFVKIDKYCDYCQIK